MDFWKMMDVIHAYQDIMNPISAEKMDRLIHLLDLKPDDRVVDIACGKGEFLVRLVEEYNVNAIGVDKSPFCILHSRKKKNDRVPNSNLEFLEMNGAEYKVNEKVNLASCIGASWVFGGYRGTLKALSKMAVTGGYVIVGEPFWLKDPDPDYLVAEEFDKDTFGTHFENFELGQELGLDLVYKVVSSLDEWDHFESLHWLAVSNYVRDHPNDLDLDELIKASDRFRHIYFKWGRDTLGWGIYVFRTS